MIVVSDTGPINYLVLIEQIGVLPVLHGKILIPPAVHAELQSADTPPPVVEWARQLPDWVEVKIPSMVLLEHGIHLGEAEAIALAIEERAVLLLMDDARGRTYANSQGLRITGTLGVLEAASRRGLVNLPDCIQRLQRTSFRAHPQLLEALLRRNTP